MNVEPPRPRSARDAAQFTTAALSIKRQTGLVTSPSANFTKKNKTFVLILRPIKKRNIAIIARSLQSLK